MASRNSMVCRSGGADAVSGRRSRWRSHQSRRAASAVGEQVGGRSGHRDDRVGQIHGQWLSCHGKTGALRALQSRCGCHRINGSTLLTTLAAVA